MKRTILLGICILIMLSACEIKSDLEVCLNNCYEIQWNNYKDIPNYCRDRGYKVDENNMSSLATQWDCFVDFKKENQEYCFEKCNG